jgi:tripartite-type tricarboxylate transporter receptor subunit TctC
MTNRLTGTLATFAIMMAMPALAEPEAGYPSHLVQLVNPFPAGSTTDGLARGLARGLSTRLGREFIVNNKPGASGGIGTLTVATADPDGYTLLFAPALVLSVIPFEQRNMGYSPADFVPICRTFVNQMVLAAPAESRLRSVADLVAEAKQRPGGLNYGHQGISSIPHMAMEQFLQTAGINVTGVPFRGEPLLVTELIAGRLDVASLVLGSAAGQNFSLLGVFGDERNPAFPDVPTVKEQGFDIAPTSFGGLLAPVQTPKPIVAKLAAACDGAAKDTVYGDAAKRAFQPHSYYADGDMFARELQHDIDDKKQILNLMKKNQ